jgi:hypothetical protein
MLVNLSAILIYAYESTTKHRIKSFGLSVFVAVIVPKQDFSARVAGSLKESRLISQDCCRSKDGHFLGPVSQDRPSWLIP